MTRPFISDLLLYIITTRRTRTHIVLDPISKNAIVPRISSLIIFNSGDILETLIVTHSFRHLCINGLVRYHHPFTLSYQHSELYPFNSTPG
jgi:hypothetical protein